MKQISVNELQPGMVLNEDIYYNNDVLLIAKGAVLTSEQIRAIKRLTYTKINIQQYDYQIPKFVNRLQRSRVDNFKATYSKYRDETVELIKYISDGNIIDMDQAYRIPGNLLMEVGSPNNLFSFLDRLDKLDDHTYGHCINVSLMCNLICKWIDLDPAQTRDITVAGLIHDIGKSHVPQAIIDKPGALNEEERKEIQRHTIYGFNILKDAQANNTVLTGALMHHERRDGSGYPTGLRGDQIPLSARIVSIADIYDAMTSDRSYRDKVSPFRVIAFFQHNFLGVLDTNILTTFLNRIAECYIGEMVRLSDGRVGQVTVINPTDPARPLLQTENGFLNLKYESRVEIDSILYIKNERE